MWSSDQQLIFSCVSIAVGLGNIWRFPKVLYENDGGVEISIAMVSLIIASYFQVILAQSLLQLFLSFTDFNLAPIAGCYGFWELKTETCFLPEKLVCGSEHAIYGGVALRSVQSKSQNRSRSSTHLRSYGIKDTTAGCVNITETMNEHFFHLSIGLKHHQLGDMANFHPQLMICLGLTWALLFLCSTMGLKPTGKVWTRAVEQVFFTFGITSGPLLVYGSYNHFFANIHKVVLFVTMLSLGASLMYAVIVFGSLGTMSWNMNIPVGDIVHGGHSVIFVAMNKYSIHWTLSTVFFLLVIVTGTNSQVLIVNVAVTHWRDMFPVIRSKRPLLVSYCIVGFAFGLPFVTKVVRAQKALKGAVTCQQGSRDYLGAPSPP
ncbi:putative sodium/chloride dependent amino acid transporter [Ixodes scapularis]